jgi:hypothetical protein
MLASAAIRSRVAIRQSERSTVNPPESIFTNCNGHSSQSMGTALLKEGVFGVPIDNVLGVTGMEDMDYQNEGLLEITINSAISAAEKISHDDARKKTLEYLQKIMRNGWQATIPRSMARIRGKDMSDFLLSTGKYTTLDPSYIPSLNEWVHYGVLTTWSFYADHTYLTVKLTRDHTLTDIAGKLAKTRANKEAEFESQGIAIDKTYVDPPLPTSASH